MAEQPEREEMIPLVEEQIKVTKREVERGRIIIRTHVQEREEIAEIALRQEDVIVERVPVGRPVEEPPPVREEDGVLIVPVLEEQVVIQTRLVLKEEIRITRKSRTEIVREPVRLKADQVDIEQLEGSDLSGPQNRSRMDD